MIEREAVVSTLRALGYPQPKEPMLVVCVRRTHGDNPGLKDPWDDAIGILTPESWRAFQGTGEPGWAPMHRQGRVPTHRAGCARLACPQFSRAAYGGGFHNWKRDRPAFRQVGPVLVERSDEGAWSPWDRAIIGRIATRSALVRAGSGRRIVVFRTGAMPVRSC